MRDRGFGGRDDRDRYDRGDDRRRDRRGGERFDDIGDTVGRFVEDAAEGIGRIFGGGRGGRSQPPASTLCDAIDREREALEMMGIISSDDYTGWIDKLERARATLSQRARDADLAYGVEAFIKELKEEKADFSK